MGPVAQSGQYFSPPVIKWVENSLNFPYYAWSCNLSELNFRMRRRLPPAVDLWQSLLSLSTLQSGWEKVRANQGASGGDGISVADFQRDAPRQIARISAKLRAGTWRPGPCRSLDVPKRKGGTRRLTIPPVGDRVVQAALAQVLTPVLEPQFEEGSYAYRPGRSVKMAHAAIARWRDRGYWHVVEADIVRFFDNLRHDRLLDKLTLALAGQSGAEPVLDLVALMLEAQAQHSGVHGRGVAQGSPLSPLLSNLYLDALDEAITARGLRLIRFADDFIVLAQKRASAEAVVEDIARVLAEEGLELHPGGTRVRDFDSGFEFLGGLFVRSMLLQAVADPEEEPDSLLRAQAAADDDEAKALQAEIAAGYDRGDRVLYLMQPGRRLSLRNRSFTVLGPEGNEIAGISHPRVDRIEIGPGATAEFAALDQALCTGTALAIVDDDGATRGMVVPPGHGRAALHLAQARAVLDPGFAVALVMRLVEARIRNQRTQLFRLNRDPGDGEVTSALAAMQRHLRKLPGQDSVAGLRGIEGACAAEYWPALGRMIQGAPHRLRRSRPAADPANAAINYLSGMLERDMTAAAGAAGLHAGFGFLHQARDGILALVYDLMEPFRAPLTEGLTAFLFNARRLRNEMFVPLPDSTVRIGPQGRAALIRGYETAVARQVNAPGRTIRLAWRPMMRRQAQDLARAIIAGDAALFQPYLMEA
jgi:CRISPR-associated protein Cas1